MVAVTVQERGVVPEVGAVVAWRYNDSTQTGTVRSVSRAGAVQVLPHGVLVRTPITKAADEVAVLWTADEWADALADRARTVGLR